MLAALSLSFAIGLFICEGYKKTYRGVMYARSFGIPLLALAMLTVISDVVLSLDMVGELSIVRFRTAIKEPLDIVFLLRI